VTVGFFAGLWRFTGPPQTVHTLLRAPHSVTVTLRLSRKTLARFSVAILRCRGEYQGQTSGWDVPCPRARAGRGFRICLRQGDKGEWGNAQGVRRRLTSSAGSVHGCWSDDPGSCGVQASGEREAERGEMIKFCHMLRNELRCCAAFLSLGLPASHAPAKHARPN
jgi:hypothetical protein